MTTKYMLVRKTKKGNWKPIWNYDDAEGGNIEGGRTSDKARVERDRERVASMFPAHEYAVLEVTEK